MRGKRTQELASIIKYCMVQPNDDCQVETSRTACEGKRGERNDYAFS